MNAADLKPGAIYRLTSTVVNPYGDKRRRYGEFLNLSNWPEGALFHAESNAELIHEVEKYADAISPERRTKLLAAAERVVRLRALHDLRGVLWAPSTRGDEDRNYWGEENKKKARDKTFALWNLLVERLEPVEMTWKRKLDVEGYSLRWVVDWAMRNDKLTDAQLEEWTDGFLQTINKNIIKNTKEQS